MDKARAKYFRERTKRLVMFEMNDTKLRQRMKEAAEADGRSLNGWFSRYVMPEIERIVTEQEKQTGKKPGR